MPKSPHYPVPALEKGLDIVETLAAATVPQSLSELAVRLDRSSSELFRMLNCLERRGYINRDPISGKYGLTLKLYTLAHAHSVIEKLLQAAREPMQRFTETCRESCHLSVLERGKLVVVAQQESPERVRLSIEVGAVFDPVRTASGRLLLAFLGNDRRAAVLGELPSAQEPGNLADGGLLAGLNDIRRRGLSTAESETIEGVRDVAVLVGDPHTDIIAALAVTRLLPRGEHGGESVLIRKMRDIAQEITASLGLATAA